MIKGYAATAPKKELVEFSYSPGELLPNEVEISITHCGICHSDLHLIDDDWDMSVYPFIPGHEIIGTVSELGSNVKHLKKGDRVGVGWQRSCCMHCRECLSGEDNLCLLQTATCANNHGGFADKIQINSDFVFLIPQALKSENSAPLLCGGITVYSPFKYYDVKASMRVGVIGIGGLGHLALQFARAFGCEVVAFSSTKSKKDEAIKFGASEFIISNNDFPSSLNHSFDFLLSTVNADLDWASYMDLLRPNGKLCIVGATPNDIRVPAFSLIVGKRSICGSPIGSRALIKEMLEFSSRHKIEAKVELFPLKEVNRAIQKLRENSLRYRAVLKIG